MVTVTQHLSLMLTFTLHREGQDHRDPQERIVLLLLGVYFCV